MVVQNSIKQRNHAEINYLGNRIKNSYRHKDYVEARGRGPGVASELPPEGS